MNRGMIHSLILHGVLVLLLIFGLPSWFRKPDPQMSAISVELLPLSELSNVKKKTQKPKKQPEKPVEKTKPVPATKAEPPKPEEKKPEPKPEEPKPEPKPEAEKPEPLPEKPKPKPEPKKEKPKEKPKKKEKPTELDSLLKSLEEPNDSTDTDEKKTKKQVQEEPVEENTKSDSDQYNESQPLSMNEQDAIRSQVEKKWSPPAGAKDAGKMQVVLRVKVQEDGTIISVSIDKPSSGFGADPAVSRAFDESAVRAVKMSSPLQNLPSEKYDNWKDFTFTFTPEGLS